MTERSLSLATLVRSGSGGKNRPPLVVLLHGYGSNEEDLFSLERFVPPECVVVSVRAPLALAHGAYAWFSLRVEAGKPVGDKHEAEEARHIFREFLAQALIKYDADPSRVILIGFSQGAIVSASTLQATLCGRPTTCGSADSWGEAGNRRMGNPEQGGLARRQDHPPLYSFPL
jgi:phospholipase/carboxylesterase